jgi:release factor glutamine methyltransferase
MEPKLNAEVLLAHALHRRREYFYAHPEQELREVEWIHYGRYLNERIGGKPTQYITGRQEFYGREFLVSPAVLIPRPETELLVEAVLRELPARSRIVDVGTGSGAIAITLALEGTHQVLATDISQAALQVAQSNAGRLQSRDREGAGPLTLTFLQTDLLTAIASNSHDAVVSNPPYVPQTDDPTLQREVRDWEPHLALFGGPTGLDIYRRLIPEAHRVLKPNGLLALEFGFTQSEALATMIEDWDVPQFLPDLAGIPRILLCRKRAR